MRTPARVAAFAAALGVTFGAAALAGASLDPLRDRGAGHGHSESTPEAHDGVHDATAAAPSGLAVAQDGYSLAPSATALPLARPTEFAFKVLNPDGQALTDYDVAHTRRMHLIVVRRDLTGYQHLHPTLDRSGHWRVRMRLPEAGAYRAYADFSTNGRAMTLAIDLVVAGSLRPVTLPSPRPIDSVAGYRAKLSASGTKAGRTTEMEYALSRDRVPLDGVEPYLGADGHLVALREGDMAFLHVHPEESHTPGTIRFGAALPSAGRYRLFLQFKHEGRVRTVAHTLEVTR